MQWISSSGGPLVLMPRAAMSEWKGALGDGSDYDLACSVEDYAGIIRWKSIDVLVLGDEPLQTAAQVTADQLILVRWMYAPDEESILECLDPDKWGAPVETLRWAVQEADCVLFDAGVEGASVQDKIEISMDTGAYRIATHVVKSLPDVGAVIHAITRQ